MRKTKDLPEGHPDGNSEDSESAAVVVTTFNDPEYLAQALASVMAQQHRVDELVVVDDGSDVSPAPIVSQFPGAVLIRQANRGLAGARNTGLKHVQSQFISFLDADDRFKPSAIRSGLACMREHPQAALVYGGHHRIHRDGSRAADDSFCPPGRDPYAELLKANFIGMHATVLYRRNRLLEIGGFNETLRRGEDYDVYLRLAKLYPIAGHRDTVAEYRWHGGNMSSDTTGMLKTILEIHAAHGDQSGRRLQAWRAGRKLWKQWYLHGQQSQWGNGVDPVTPPAAQRTSAFRRLRDRLSNQASAAIEQLRKTRDEGE